MQKISTHSAYFQHTLKKAFTCIGRGLRSGVKTTMTIFPAKENTGYRFIRRDIEANHNEIVASWETVIDSFLCITIENKYGIRVSSIEHLIAALSASGIDNARIVLDSPEIPILDGSAKTYISLIENAGIKEQCEERKVILINEMVRVQNGDKCASLLPANELWIDIAIQNENPAVGQQRCAMAITNQTFKSLLAPARSFGFSEQVHTLQKLGFIHDISQRCLIKVDQHGSVSTQLRFKDEFIRHKVLDTVGDLSLCGAPVIGRYFSKQANHKLNHDLLCKLMRRPKAFSYLTVREWLGSQHTYEFDVM